MSENCNHDCSNCSQNCSSRTEPQDLSAKLNEVSHVKKVIAVVSGKGGVGKSLITSMLAIQMQRKGYQTGVLDADITGPSIPKIFGVETPAYGNEHGMLPNRSDAGTKVVSINMMLDDPEQPVLWRGPILAGIVKQFWSEVVWDDVDYMFVDMPPGTGDVPLTVFQSLPIDGIIIVTSPQELVSMIVAKAVNMANMMNIPILGLVENYSYLECPDCGKKIEVFGKSHLHEVADKYNLPILGRMPINPIFAELCDAGNLEAVTGNPLEEAVVVLEEML